MLKLWSPSELKAATAGDLTRDFSASGLSIDTREIQKGDVFIALKAARDGHEFVAQALKNGAAGVIVSHIPEGCENAPLLLVDDVETALSSMARYRRNQVSAKIVAVTGSAGKTSTKEMLLHMFSEFGSTHASVKSFNNHWGVPLTLARMPKDTQFGVFEIGMNHPGEIEPLVKLTRPDVVVITNIAPVHLAGFEDVMGIAREKASIMRGLSDDGVAVVFGDMKYRDFINQYSKHDVHFFGENPENQIQITNLQNNDAQASAVLQMNGRNVSYSLAVTGKHHLINAAAALGVAEAFSLDLDRAASTLASWTPPEGRGQEFTISLKNGQILLVDESYNANPLSMRAAIDAFLKKPAKRHIAILGDMAELGSQSEQFHRELASDEGVASLDRVHALGKEMKYFYEELGQNRGKFFSDKADIIVCLENIYHDGDALLIKGSNSVGLGSVVDVLKQMMQSASQP